MLTRPKETAPFHIDLIRAALHFAPSLRGRARAMVHSVPRPTDCGQDGPVRAMSPATGPLPTGPGWGYEMSWPGPRLFLDVAKGRARVVTPDDRDVTRQWPELLSMCTGVDDALIEGHLVEVDPGAPVAFVCSDLLRLYGVDLAARPYRDRRGSLARLARTHPLLTLSPVFDDAEATAAAAREHGLDGVVAKRLDSPYREGVRSEDWVRFAFDAAGGPTREGEK
jgi:bifunctional non-homologous end joining protein LigD